ncbi:glycosyltransferase family 2 protein [Methanocella sp. MCL-LM]|uniref:glycosyltransferase family 2 protein n=1 Tax=Methanocella sp. MCL-LM TaxID=3412035 RepID=UPI003C75AF31
MNSNCLLLLPTLNEETALKALVPEIPAGLSVLVVDGGSTDKTREIAEGAGCYFLKQQFGKGKGCGVRTAMEYFLQGDYEYLAMIDADYTCDPRELDRLIERLGQGYQVVLGSRDPQKQIELLGRFSLFINRLTSRITTLAYSQDLPDIQSCYWVFSRKAVETIYPGLSASGFDIEYDIVFNSWKEGLKIGYCPVTIRPRMGESKFTKFLRLKQIWFGLTYIYRSLVIMARRALSGSTGEADSGCPLPDK